jgi:hypothetical protein
MSHDKGRAQRGKEGATREALAGLISITLYNITSQKKMLFIVKAKRTSNFEYKLISLMNTGWNRRNKETTKH